MSDTLCWSCQNACGKCSWNQVDLETKKIKFQPVPGWKATPTVKKSARTVYDSYEVTYCPEYVKDEPRSQAQQKRNYRIDRETILEMLEEGCSTNDIADVFDCSEVTIRSIRQEFRKAGLL